MSFRILITGATGMLGTDLCQVFARHGLEYRGWSRHGHSSEERIDLVNSDAEETIRRIREYRPAVVIHTAAMSDVDGCELHPEEAFKNNAETVHRVAQGCEAAHAVLCALSTDYVFDGTLDRPYREQDPVNPLCVYARSKLEGERYALAEASRCMVVRVSGLFGSARSNFVTQTVERFKTNQPVPVVTNQKYSPSWTKDVADGLYQLIGAVRKDPSSAKKEGRLHGIFHLANGGKGSRSEVALVIGRFLGIGSPDTFLRPMTWKALQRPAQRPVNSQLECKRWEKLFGAPLRPWQEALSDFLATSVIDPKTIP